MEITSELLAAYAEGNVSKEEREAVRQYLAENPAELESVMMMMDDFYDLTLDDDIESVNEETESGNVIQMVAKKSDSDIMYSAAAFAPRMAPMQRIIETPGHADNGSFAKRLDDFMSEIEETEL